MKKLKIAYFGTPDFSARFLEKLLTDTSIKRLIEVKLVVTQPDQPVGRKRTLTPTPVKQVAQKYDLNFFTGSVKDIDQQLDSIDLGLIYYFGQFIPESLLKKSKFGFWNIHFSLLPRLRGTTPATFSLILGDKKTGVSLIQTDKKMDHGDLIAQEELYIAPDETRIELEERLHNLAYKIFIEQINNLLNNKIKLTPQDHSQATFTVFPIKKDYGFIPLTVLKKALKNEFLPANELPKIIKDFSIKNNETMKQWNSEALYNLFRGLHPWPGLWTLVNIKGLDKRLKITDMSMNHELLTINHVQLEGKKEVDLKTFNSAYGIF